MKIKCKSEEEKIKIVERDCPFQYDIKLLSDAIDQRCDDLECSDCFKRFNIDFEVEE